MKPTLIVEGEVAYILGWAGEADQGNQENIPAFGDLLKDHDLNKDGKLAVSEAPLRYRKDLEESDFDHDGFTTNASGTNSSKSDRQSIR